MPQNTSFANLTTFDRVADANQKFIEFRDALAGTGDSNMNKIDSLFESQDGQIETLDGRIESLEIATSDGLVDLVTNQTIDGAKTFLTSPTVPNKTASAANQGTEIATEAQVFLKADSADVVKLTGNQTISGTKNFTGTLQSGGADVVSTAGNQTIAGTKTFSTSPVVPSKTAAAANAGTSLATEAQVYLKANDADVVKTAGDQTIAGVKTFSSNPISSASQGTTAGSLARYDAVVQLANNQTIAGTKTFSSNVVVPVTPTANGHATSMQWVNSQLDNKANLEILNYAMQVSINRIYNGADLTIKFASEISGYSSVWTWIQARIKAANFANLFVGDYIPFSIGANNFKAEIAGIDTYYRYGDTEVPHHIDFITRDCHPDLHVYNKVNYNNGTSVSAHPWLASDLYAWLNGLQMNVPNTAVANPTLVAVDYRTTGVYPQLPAALKDVIIEKRLLLPTRYTAGSLLVDDNSWAWANAGKLWIPSEVEVYGCNMWGTTTSTLQGLGSGGFVQYPIFGQNMKRIKGAGDGGARSNWWLSSAFGGNSSNCAVVSSYGNATNANASDASIRAPLCFRIA